MNKWIAMENIVKEKLEEMLSDGKVHYICPLFLVEYKGKEYERPTYGILHYLIKNAKPVENRLNYWQMEKK